MASASAQSLSINMVMSTAIKGSNFLQMSVNKLHTYARKVEKINLLGATKFPLLKKNLNSLDNHLGHIRKTTAKISANPIKLDVQTSRTSLKEARKDMTGIEHDAKQIMFYTKKASENLRAGATVQNKSMHKKAKSSQSNSSAIGALGIATAIVLPFKASIDFESNMARVGALANVDKKSKEFKELQSTALKLGRETEWSANQVAKAMQYTSMAGLSANETIAAMPSLLSLATAGATDLASTSNIATNIMGGFDFKATDTIDGMSAMTYVADIMAKTITTSNVSMESLGDTMKYVSPVAKKAGMSLQEASAMAGLLGNIGISGSQAGTTLKSMLSRLSAPPTEARKALNELGLSTKDLQGNLKSVPLLLSEVSKATSKMGNADQLKYMSKIFGLEPMAGASKLVDLAGAGKLQEYVSIVKQYKGSAKKIADAQLETVAGQMKILSSAFEGLSLSATSGLLAPLKGIVIGITSVVSAVTWITDTFPIAGSVVLGLGSTLAVGTIALMAFGFASNMLSGSLTRGIFLLKGFGTGLLKVSMYAKTGLIYGYRIALNVLSFSARVAGGAIKFAARSILWLGRALLMNPIGLAITAIAGAAYLIYSNWDYLKVKTIEIFNSVASFISSVGIGIKNTFIAMFNWSPIGLIVNNWGKIGGYFRGIANSIKKPFVSFFDWISSKFKAVFGLIDKAKSVVNAPIDAVKSGASKLWSGTKSFFGFGDDKKEPIKSKIPKAGVPVNNVDFKPSSLKEAQIAQVPLESVSDVTAGAINETKSFMQNNTNTSNSTGVNQTITNHITVHATDGKIDEEDLYEKFARVQKRVAQDEQDLQLQDIAV